MWLTLDVYGVPVHASVAHTGIGAIEFGQYLVEKLREQLMQQYVDQMSGAVENMTPEDMARMKDMFAELNNMLEQRQRGEEPDFDGFMEYGGPSLAISAGRSVTVANNGIVATSHPLAAQIGLDVLKQGGNAVDAAIATSAAMGLLEPMSCGIGGDGISRRWSPTGASRSGAAAAGARPARRAAAARPAGAA